MTTDKRNRSTHPPLSASPTRASPRERDLGLLERSEGNGEQRSGRRSWVLRQSFSRPAGRSRVTAPSWRRQQPSQEGKPRRRGPGSLSLPHLLLQIQPTLTGGTMLCPPSASPFHWAHFSQEAECLSENRTRRQGPRPRRTLLPRSGAAL